MMLPHGIFFKPNAKFLNTMASEYKDVGILEAGSGVGHVLKVVKEYGKNYGISAMSNIRGFDIHRRTEYEVPEFEIFMADALDLTVYHQRLQVLVCRPDHGGWVSELLEQFLLGEKVCKRFIYVGKPENIEIDFDEDQLLHVHKKVEGVGEDNETMLVWEIV
ncbi:hypothetical protein vB_AbaM_Acibel004_64 [Acinetobacter phage vB_AbaM_Acibel004]|uniref:hypothetical protein n=1 Tax=Acinetobacter phage vB_AbaM_Acibel004 TaxID=1481186 RepID=UPI0004E83820|nr:hypothetical protein vB_AbaM_Acibel004_64 [Acinetobacter phage vB_AbaM_Acibel004]AHY26679.1 hypothetical protein vB_AbaM_Acibel004_64 [Acinetobacter phage vB_AbaM_Acibel004]